jgi:hypothetical protein
MQPHRTAERIGSANAGKVQMQSAKGPGSPEDAAILPPIDFDPAMVFESSPVQAAFEYWESQRRGRLMPTLAELDHDDMHPFLDNVGLVEIRPDPNSLSDYFVGFAGPRIESIFGARTGRTLSDGVPDAIAARWRLGFDMVRRSAKPIRATAHVAFEGKTEIETEILVAPLGDDTTPSAFFVAINALDRH